MTRRPSPPAPYGHDDGTLLLSQARTVIPEFTGMSVRFLLGSGPTAIAKGPTMTVEKLRESQQASHDNATAIVAAADAEGRQLNNDEIARVKGYTEEFTSLAQQIEQRQQLETQTQTLAEPAERRTSQTEPSTEPAGLSRITGGTFRNDDRGMWGFRDMGEYGKAVAHASRPGAQIDQRLLTEQRADPDGANEGMDSEGGFAVPPDARRTINELIRGEDSLLGRCDEIPVESNRLTVPTDESAPWGSTGIQAYWDAEQTQATQSKPVLQEVGVDLYKLRALAPATDELLADNSAMSAYLNRKLPEVITYKVNEAIIAGTGAGQPLGLINSGAAVSVAKVGSQVADTVVGQNILDMWSRMWGPSRANAVWLVNQDTEVQLNTLMKVGKLDTGAADSGWGISLYTPPGGLSQAPYGTLMGRPVIPQQACKTVGDVGDVILVDLKQYLATTKGGGITMSSSIHLWFDWDVTAFKAVVRMGGQPWWSAAVSPKNGSNTLSPIVTIAARA